MQGHYIVVEGIDGSGKTTLAKNIVKRMNEMREGSAVYIREPSNSRMREQIEHVKQLEPRNEDEILSMLFAADRLILKDEIFEYLYRGITVVSDRSKYSSYAYQNTDPLFNSLVNQYMTDPDVVLYLDITPEIAKTRYDGKDKFENTVTLTKVKNWYDKYLKQITEEEVIDYVSLKVGSLSKGEVTNFMMGALKQLGIIQEKKT